MLLPQSSAFAALKNRLNSVSSIGLIHVPGRSSSVLPGTSPTIASTSSRLAGSGGSGASSGKSSRAEGNTVSTSAGDVKWNDLLEKFRVTQERARRRSRGLDSDTNPSDVESGSQQRSAFRNSRLDPGDERRYSGIRIGGGEKALPDIPIRLSGPGGPQINTTDVSGIVRPGSGSSGNYPGGIGRPVSGVPGGGVMGSGAASGIAGGSASGAGGAAGGGVGAASGGHAHSKSRSGGIGGFGRSFTSGMGGKKGKK